MKKINKESIKNILLIKNDHIGDIILSSNVFREIRNNFPQSKITLIASPENKALVEKNKNIDEVIELKYSPRKFKEFMSYLKISKKIRKEGYDLGIDLRGGFFNIFLLLFLGRVKKRIGFYHQKIGKIFLDYGEEKTHWDKFKRHCTMARLDLINRALGLNSTNNWPEIATDEEDQKLLEELIEKNKLKRFICIVPDAREDKQWPLEKFDEFIKKFEKKYPEKQIVILGADEEQINFLVKRNPKSIPLIKENLRVLYLLFQKSDLVIAHDGGPVHISWVGKSRTLDLIEKRLPLKWIQPLGENSRYIYAELSKLEVDEVMKLSEEILRK